MDKAFLACSYALMITKDGGVDVTAEKLNTLMTTAGLNVPAYYAKFFVSNMKG